jgi:hypothetical protein
MLMPKLAKFHFDSNNKAMGKRSISIMSKATAKDIAKLEFLAEGR